MKSPRDRIMKSDGERRVKNRYLKFFFLTQLGPAGTFEQKVTLWGRYPNCGYGFRIVRTGP